MLSFITPLILWPYTLDTTKGIRYSMNMKKATTEREGNMEQNCNHPSTRLFAWHAYDGTLCVCCCECGEVLQGEEQ